MAKGNSTLLDKLRDGGFQHAMIHITGESDTGKTSMALQSGASPEETVFIDADIKGRATVAQLVAAGFKFGHYEDLVTATMGMKEVEYHDYCMGVLEKVEALPPKNRRVIVWDTWEPFEKTLKPVVAANPKKFRDHYSPMGQIRGAEEWLASFDYEAELISRITNACELFMCVTHVKPYNIGGRRVPGKVVDDRKKPVLQKSLMRVWLRHNPEGDVPIGLVMKRPGKDVYVKGKGIRKINVLPRRLTPQEGEESVWDVIERYWEEPIGSRKPEVWEIPNAFELSILEGTLTEDQKMTLQAALVAEKAEEEVFEPLREERAKEMSEAGKGYDEIAKELGCTIPQAMALVKKGSER